MTNRARHEVDFIATPQLPPRDAHGHKGSFGSVLVIGGCVHGERTMLGGIMLAARGALRVGAGRVIAAVPGPLASEALLMLPEATVVALAVDNDGALLASEAAAALDRASHEASVTLIGPALGRSASLLARLRGQLLELEGSGELEAARSVASHLVKTPLARPR